MRAVTLLERRQGGAHLLHRDSRLHSANCPQKPGPPHHPFVRESRKLKWFRRPNFRDRIRLQTMHWHVRQDANDGVRHSIERDAASDYVRIAAESLLPKAFCDHRDIRAFLFIRPKIPTQYWPDAEHIEIVRSYSAPENLNRIADSSQCEAKSVLGGETVKKCLSFTVMLIARRGDRDIDKIARLVASEHVHDTRRFLEREPAQEKIVDQAEDRGVQPDPERQCDDSDAVNPGDLRSSRKANFRSFILLVAKCDFGKLSWRCSEFALQVSGHSARSAITGSTRAARRAGNQHAIITAMPSTIAAQMHAIRSGLGISAH